VIDGLRTSVHPTSLGNDGGAGLQVIAVGEDRRRFVPAWADRLDDRERIEYVAGDDGFRIARQPALAKVLARRLGLSPLLLTDQAETPAESRR
jgi:hypothetical protein